MKDKDFCLCEDNTFADWATAYCHFTKRTGNIVDVTLTYWNDFLNFTAQTTDNYEQSLTNHISKLLIQHLMKTYQIMPITVTDTVIKNVFSYKTKSFLLTHCIDENINSIYLFNLKGHIYIIGNIYDIDKDGYTITTLEGLVYTVGDYLSTQEKTNIINELYTVFKPYAKVIV